MATHTLTPVATVRAQALALVTPLASEKIRLSLAAGRISATKLGSPVAQPSQATAMMDGYAVRSKEIPATLPVIGAAAAGKPFVDAIPPNACIKIATGAGVPATLDTVIPFEDTKLTNDQVTIPAAQPGQWLRLPGSELTVGEPVLAPGQQITSRRLALLTSLGVDRVTVFRQPRIGVLASGDELRQPGQNLPPGTIYDANRPMLLSLLAHHGFLPVDLGCVADDVDEIQAALAAAHTSCDAVISIGGASVGEKDYLRQVMQTSGTLHAWQVAIKPGKPFFLGQLEQLPVFGLPGNPASAFVSFLLLVLPALWQLAGYNPLPQLPWLRASTVGAIPKTPGREDYQRGILHQTAAGYRVELAGKQTSAPLHPLAQANCLIRIPAEIGKLAAASDVEVLPLDLLD